MNILDLIIIMTLLISVIYSLIRGFVKEIFSLLSIIVGIFVSIKFYHLFSIPIDRLINRPNISKVAGFFLCFIIVSLGISLAGSLIRRLLKTANIFWMDRLIGAGFGIVKGVLIWSTILIFLIIFLPPETQFLEASKTAPYIMPISIAISRLTSKKLKEDFDKKLKKYASFCKYDYSKGESLLKDSDPNKDQAINPNNTI